MKVLALPLLHTLVTRATTISTGTIIPTIHTIRTTPKITASITFTAAKVLLLLLLLLLFLFSTKP